MPRPKELTTRRERYLYDRELYRAREFKWRTKSWHWARDIDTGRVYRVYRKWEHFRGPKIDQRLVNGKTYNYGQPYEWWVSPAHFTISKAGPRRPPHVAWNSAPVWGTPPQWTHQRFPVLGYHRRGVKTRSKRPRDARNTAFNRRVTGCNWYYFRTGFFPVDDVLGRLPNEETWEEGDPYEGPGFWPSPLGYVS